MATEPVSGVRVTPFREAQASGPTLLQALLVAIILAATTFLGWERVLASEACAAIYVGALTHVFMERRPARRDNGGDSGEG